MRDMSIYRKHRPQKFCDVQGQEHVKASVTGQLEAGKTAHAYLFSGPRGVGKTTMARLIAKRVNCVKPDGAEPCGECDACVAIQGGKAIDVIEIDAASHTSVDHVREHIIERVRVTPTQLKNTVFIIDEVHMLSKSAFNALLKTLEEPPAHVHFILATTELHKIPDTIISRCQRFDFFQIPHDVMVRRLETLCQAEGIKVDKEVLDEVARRSGGSQRDAESLLDQLLTLGSAHITRDVASAVLPIIRIEQITDLLGAWAEGNLEKAVRTLQNTVDNGTEISRFQSALVEIIRSVLLSRLGAPEVSLPYEAKQQNEIRTVLNDVPQEKLRTMLNGVLDASRNMHDGIPQLALELLSVDLCNVIAAPVAPPVVHVEAVTEGPGAQKAEIRVESKPEVVESKSAPQPKVTSDSAEGDLDLDIVKKKWSVFQKELRKKHASLPLALELAEPINVDGKQVNIHVPFAFYAETVNSDQNNRFLAQLLSEVLEQPALIRAEHKVAQNNTVDALVDAFGGDVVG